MNYIVLVNKKNPLNKNYIPKGLIEYPEYNGEKVDCNYKTYVNKRVLRAFQKLQHFAKIEGKNKGYPNGYGFVIDSGYRSYDYQQRIWDYNIGLNGETAENFVALPGCSEHQTGLAIDVALNTNGLYNDKFDDNYNEIKWLHTNCHRFGFILRYPKGKESITGYDYEWWHLRYVTKKVACYMYRNNIETLEEYLENTTKIALE